MKQPSLVRWMPVLGILLLSFFACKDGDKTPKTKSSPAAETDSTGHKKMNLPEQSTEWYVTALINRKETITKQLPGITEAEAVQLYLSLGAFVDTVLAGITQNEAEWVDKYATYSVEQGGQWKRVLPAAVKKKVDLLATAGLVPTEIGEGLTELMPIPYFYVNLFKNTLPADYRKFLELRADEDTVLHDINGGLAIPFRDIGKRVIKWELFLDNYPESKLAANANEQYKSYLCDYLFGTEYTPVFEYNDDIKTFIQENKEEYDYFAERHARSRSGAIVKLYLEKLETENAISSLRSIVESAIDHAFLDPFPLLPVQPDFGPVEIELMVGTTYDKLPKELKGHKIERELDSLIYFQQAGNAYAVAIFKNQIVDAGKTESGWVDIWAFKNDNGDWKKTAQLLHAGGGGTFGSPGYFFGMQRLGNNSTGIVITGNILKERVSQVWTDIIELTNDKLIKPMSITAYYRKENEKGGSISCSQNKWFFQKNGNQDHYDLVITPSSCSNTTMPYKRITIPYVNGVYAVPGEFLMVRTL
ncbi:MAG: hypothetical protein J7578_06120 [Chitinophagaceae bacterium]|nr:hypothetical protein [Chitinophagaceae bacterium]